MASKLEQGIEILYNMELNNYFMTIAIRELNEDIDQLGKGKVISQPSRGISYVTMADTIPIFIVICAIIGAIVGVIVGFNEQDEGLILSIVLALIDGVVFFTRRSCCWCSNRIYLLSNKKSIDISERQQKYSRAKRSYEHQIAEEPKRIAKEKKQREILISQRNALINRKKEATIKLNKFYQIMHIDKQYRNIVPIGYMYEFMRLGISKKLDGADGLYYLIRQELRADQMQRSLEDISSKLDTIINNQHQLHKELVNLDYKCTTLIREAKKSAELSAKNNQLLQEAVVNTSISAYNSQRIKQELKYQNFMLKYGK